MTDDNEIIKALEHNANKCRLYEDSERQGLYKSTLGLIKRQKEKIKEFDEKLVIQQGLIDYQKAEIERLNKDCEDVIYKLEYLLCNATGNKFSKYTYPIGDMVSYVNDYIQDCCNEAVEEAKEAIKSEAIREFAERLKTLILSQLTCSTMGKKEAYYLCLNVIDNLVIEMTEVETNQRKEDEGK